MIRQRYYNPGQLTDAELKAGFVVRQYEFKELVKIIRQEPASGPLQHILVIGPRGMGKTSLGLRALVEVRETPDLSAIWQPVPFFEESYGVSDLAALWLTALRHLSDATKEPEWAKRADALLAREKDADRLAAAAYAALADYRQQSGKRPILFIENLDDLFHQFLNKRELAGLRSLLQERNDLLVLGTANSVFDAIASHGEPFYEFFRQVKLRGLEREETMSFLDQLAQRPEFAPLQEVLIGDPGRVATVRTLTGGNPRLIALAAKMISESPIGTAREDLERLIDDQTPYFKARIETLPAQARVVFHTLAAGWKPMSASEIAAEARLSSSHASAQLKYLTERGYTEIVEGALKRNRRYQILERFYNVYYLLRFTRDQKARLERLIDFVSAMFGSSAFSKMATATIERMMADPNNSNEELQALNILLYKIKKEYDDSKYSSFWKNFIKICNGKSLNNVNFLVFGIKEIINNRDSLKTAIKLIEDYLHQNEQDISAWETLARFLMLDEEEKKSCTAALRSKYISCEDDQFWHIIGLLYLTKLKNNDAIQALRRSIIINPSFQKPWRALANALENEEKFIESEKSLSISLRVNPLDENDLTSIIRVSFFRLSKEISSIFHQMKKLISINPTNETGLEMLGAHFASAGDFKKSSKYFRRSAYSSTKKEHYIIRMINCITSSRQIMDINLTISYIEEMIFETKNIEYEIELGDSFKILADAFIDICAEGYYREAHDILEVGWLAAAFEPLRYAIKLEMGEEVTSLPAEINEAVEEARRQIANWREKKVDGRQS